MRIGLLSGLLGVALISSNVVLADEGVAKGDAAAGKTKALVCGACHGADGNSVNPAWPKLAGQHASYIAKQLANFKDKEREDAVMYPQAMNLTEQDMLDLGAYFASQKVSEGKAADTAIELGEQVYRGGNSATGVSACIGCHGPSGLGNPAAKFPLVKGQHADYIQTQLLSFRTSTRANDAGKMMRNLAVRMTDAEISAVSQYISGLK